MLNIKETARLAELHKQAIVDYCSDKPESKAELKARKARESERVILEARACIPARAK